MRRKRKLENGQTGERFIEEMAPEANLEEVTGTRHKANEGKGILGEEQHENYPVTAFIWKGQERDLGGVRPAWV